MRPCPQGPRPSRSNWQIFSGQEERRWQPADDRMPYHAKQQGHTQNVTGEPWRVERRVLPMNIHHNQSRSAECRFQGFLAQDIRYGPVPQR